MRLALYQPDIAPNVGTLIRLGACLGAAVDVIEPCGFPASDKSLKRAAMDYADLAEVRRHDDWASFNRWRQAAGHRLVLVETRGLTAHMDFTYQPSDIVMLGRESAGTPPDVEAACDVWCASRCGQAYVASMWRLPGLLRSAKRCGRRAAMSIETHKQQAADWFAALRNDICAAFERIEDDYAHAQLGDRAPGRFVRKSWEREDPSGAPGGGGVMSVMKGRVFEKVGVNISTVQGTFSPEFAKSIHGASEDPRFFASGISLVAHMHSPHVPAVHMNTRFLVTTQSWFGGGADLNPPFPVDADTADFHAAFKSACDAANPDYFAKYKKWCDEYFYIPHRNRARGVGGIFYDQLSSGDWTADFAFTQDVGKAFLDIYPQLVRRNVSRSWSLEEREAQLRYRGLYAEFNLVYDRGTLFGLKTGGNIEAILMSLPPEAKWD